jgi:hypothetical protein
MAVNREPVKSVADLSRAIDNTGPVVALNLYRNGAEHFLVIR